MCCATKTKVNDVGEKVDHKYGGIEIGMSIYIWMVFQLHGDQKRQKRNKEMCKNGTKVEKKMKHSLNKTK